MSGASARRKGHSYERKVAKELRKLGFDALTSRQADPLADPKGIDIAGTFPLAIQCKAVERLGAHSTILEGMDPGAGAIPVLYHKRARQPETVTLFKDDFHELIQTLITEGIWKI